MSKLLLLLIPFWLGPLLAQPTAEEKVLQSVQQMMANDAGTVIFSELYNDDRFNSEEKAFLGRLYEIFFQIPLFLKSEYERTGEIPTVRKRSRMDTTAGAVPWNYQNYFQARSIRSVCNLGF